eukprot:2135179-Amphidinium_carterae.1
MPLPTATAGPGPRCVASVCTGPEKPRPQQASAPSLRAALKARLRPWQCMSYGFGQNVAANDTRRPPARPPVNGTGRPRVP